MANADLTLTLHREGELSRLAVAGELDLSTRDALIGAAVGTLGPRSRLELDLTAVTYCDSLGISALVAVRNIAVNEGATVVVTGIAPQVERVLRTTGLLALLTGRVSGQQAQRGERLVRVRVHPDLAADDLDDPAVGVDHKRDPLGRAQPNPRLTPNWSRTTPSGSDSSGYPVSAGRRTRPDAAPSRC